MQKIIAHRANLYGPDPATENTVRAIEKALEYGFDVEVDVWYRSGWWLGHDEPKEKTDIELLMLSGLWLHAKDIPTARRLMGNTMSWFFHQADDIALTSCGHLWTFPGKELTNRSIACLPENVTDWDVSGCFGVCTDYPFKFR